MQEYEGLSLLEIKDKLFTLFQNKKYVEFDILLSYVSKRDKIGKVALKKEVELLVKDKLKADLTSSEDTEYDMPSSYFLQNNAVMQEIKDGSTYVCEYCIISEIHRTNDNEESLFTIFFPQTQKYVSVKSEEFVENKLFETILLNNGIYIGDKLKNFRNYINGFIRVNLDRIPTIIRVNRTGWQEITIKHENSMKRTKAYCNPILRNELTYTDNIANTIFKDGDIVTATEILKTALCYKGSCISVLASLASVLIKPLGGNGLSNFVVNFSGSTGEGKTLSTRIGLSLFGNVQEAVENSLINSMNSTAVGNEFLFSQFLDMPILLDEAGTIKGTAEKKAQHVIEVIFQFFSGNGKTRGQKNLTLRKTERARGVLFLTMEYDLKSIERQSGVIEKGYYRRTIEVDSTSGNFLPTKDIYDFSNINSNFGWIAEIFVNSFVANHFEYYPQIKEDFYKYEKELTTIEMRGKEKYFAILHVVLEHLIRIGLISNFEYQKAKEQLKIVYDENLETMREITTNKAQVWAEMLLEFLAIHKSKFENYDNKEQWGKFSLNKNDEKEIHIYHSVFSNFCMEKGINERSFCKELYEKGALIVERLTNGSVRYKVKRLGTPVICLLQDNLEKIATVQNGITVEIQNNVENAKKFITPNVKVEDGKLIGEDGEVIF